MSRRGGPSGAWRIPLSDVRLSPAAVEAAREVLREGWLSSGPRVERFESEFARYVSCRHAVACSSGTAALQLALAALRLGGGDEVVMPSLTFVAAANAVSVAGCTPSFADVIGPDDPTMDPESVASRVTDRTKAIVLMHYAGHPCRPALLDTARERGIPVIEDAAHALGAAGAAGPCGSWGAAGCFSFFANKNLPLGEGGMLTTDSDEIAETARRLRSHGLTTTTWQRHTGAPAGYDVTEPGWNMRLDEVRAAMGQVMLAELDRANAARGRLVQRYRTLLSDVEVASMPFAARPAEEQPAHHLAVAVLSAEIDRDAIAEELRGRGIQTSVHYPPVHAFSAYRGCPASVERTDALAPRLLTLPLHPHMPEGQVEEVVGALRTALGRGGDRVQATTARAPGATV